MIFSNIFRIYTLAFEEMWADNVICPNQLKYSFNLSIWNSQYFHVIMVILVLTSLGTISKFIDGDNPGWGSLYIFSFFFSL
jgi:hypothetical protein